MRPKWCVAEGCRLAVLGVGDAPEGSDCQLNGQSLRIRFFASPNKLEESRFDSSQISVCPQGIRICVKQPCKKRALSREQTSYNRSILSSLANRYILVERAHCARPVRQAW
jgi:hypothetical protein